MAKFGLIGKSLSHSKSVQVHALLGDYEYELIEIPDASGIKAVLDDCSYGGFNVTIPYKTEVIQYMDELSDEAAEAGAVNVIKRLSDGRLKGYNTDIVGFVYMVGDRVKGRNCLVLGTGGASMAVAAGLRSCGASEIVFVSRNPEEAQGRLGASCKIIPYDKLPLYHDFEIVVNTTPVGQTPGIEHSPITDAGLTMRIFSRLELAVDLIYSPFRTKFLQDARRLTGCKTMSGLEMLIVQAMGARDIWFESGSMELKDRLLSIVQLRAVKKKLLKKQLNIVAVGMPGSGKTTICRRFAYEFGLDFVDTDEETEKLMGKPIAEVLGSGGEGEQYFREKESEAILAASRLQGTVIATGGGSLLNPVNRDCLRCNGIVVYIKRPLELLSTRNRPLSQRNGLKDLLDKRDRIYSRVADLSAMNTKVFGERKARTGEGDSFNYELKKYIYNLYRIIERKIDEMSANRWA